MNADSPEVPPDHRDLTPLARQLFVNLPVVEPAIEALMQASVMPACGPVFASLLENLKAVVSVATIPYKQQRQTLFENFVKNQLPIERRRDPSLPTSDFHPKVKALLVERFRGYCDAEPGRSQLDSTIFQYLGFSLERGLGSQAQHLLRQTAVSTWTSFEVLFEDLVRVLIAERTAEVVRRFMETPSVKKLFERDIRDFNFEALVEVGFDAREAAERVFLETRRLDHIYNIRTACSALFPASTQVNETLKSETLRLLFFRRNLIVHRASRVDARYIRESGEKCPAGVSLDLTAEFVESCVVVVAQAANALLEASAEILAA